MDFSEIFICRQHSDLSAIRARALYLKTDPYYALTKAYTADEP